MKFRFSYLLFFILINGIAVADEQPAGEPSTILMPAFSYFIPGLGSFFEKDYSRGFKFLGFGVAGFGINQAAQERINDFWNSGSTHYNHYRDLQAERIIGGAIYAESQMLSLYDSFSFRAFKSRTNGKYLFLPENQNVESILKAPFKFAYLRRWTTFVPFTLAILAGYIEFNDDPRPEKFTLRPVDIAASSCSSYVAGTGEEAFFRGWMYPVLYENTRSHFASNAIQGTVFGFAHGPTPYFQLAFGFYSGWLNKKNNFDLGEAIFIHAWWDFWVMAAAVARNRSTTEDLSFQLPPFQFSF